MRQTSSVTVLLVGDTTTVQDLQSSMFHELVYGRGIDEALTILSTCHVDIVVIEMACPAAAIDCSQRLRAVLGEIRIPIVLVGAHGGLIGGADDYLPGPLQPHDLFQIATSPHLLDAHLAASQTLFREAKTVRIRRMRPNSVGRLLRTVDLPDRN